MVELDPTDLEYSHILASEKHAKAQSRVYLLNFLLIAFVVVVFVLSNHRVIHGWSWKGFVIPVISLIFPFLIVKMYPSEISDIKSVLKKPVQTIRLTFTGALMLVLFINILLVLDHKWILSLFIGLVVTYITSLFIAIRPVTDRRVLPPSSWSINDTLIKVAAISLLVFASKYLWGIFFVEILKISTFRGDMLFSLIAVSVMIPFYLGYNLAGLPEEGNLMTHGFSESEVIKKFSHENLS